MNATMNTALVEAATSLFAARSTPDAVRDAEDTGWAPELWQAVSDTGFSDVGVPEEFGGAGGDAADAVTLLRVAGAHAAPIPLAEAGLVGGWLLGAAGIALPPDVRTVVSPDADLRLAGERLSGTAYRVPWGHRADHVVALVSAADGCAVVVAPRAAAAVTRGVNLAGEPRDTLTFDAVAVQVAAAPPGVDAEALHERAALGRAALMAGALTAVAATTLRYTGERVQFGRPIGRFQAVQIHVVTVHQQAALVNAAVDGAVAALDRGRAGFEIACAKLLADRGAQLATRAAHQAHGAMGMTREYPLQQHTRRLWAWRDEGGGDRRWASSLGAALVAAGPDGLYPAVQAGL